MKLNESRGFYFYFIFVSVALYTLRNFTRVTTSGALQSRKWQLIGMS